MEWLHRRNARRQFDDFVAGHAAMWIDTTTNLPVRVALVDGAGTPVVQSDVEWVAPTGANASALTLAPPAGFTRVPSVDAAMS
jgi:hypothetical protein